ncbi:putative RNA-binding protein, partial [Trypanosoma conorhini]
AFSASKAATLSTASTAGAHGGAFPVTLLLSFVEFAEPENAKAMIDYCRNASTKSKPFSFLSDASAESLESSHFSPDELQRLLSVRASPARKPIHDKRSLDAVLVPDKKCPRRVLRQQPCRFGCDGGGKTLGSDVDAGLPASSASAAVFAGSGGGLGGGGEGNAGVAAPESPQWRSVAASALQPPPFRDDAAEAPPLWPAVGAVAVPATWLEQEVGQTGELNPLEGVSFLGGADDAAKVENKCGLPPRLQSYVDEVFR